MTTRERRALVALRRECLGDVRYWGLQILTAPLVSAHREALARHKLGGSLRLLHDIDSQLLHD